MVCDVLLNRLWLCTFTLAVSVGAVLLLPVSILANEALLVFPNSYYLQWVNSSLIHGLYYNRQTTFNDYLHHCSDMFL
jgi:LMBR1-like membrane protein